MKKEENKLIKEALGYVDQGLSIFPIKPRDKVPMMEWSPRQTTKADSETVRMWWKKWPIANIGIVTGKISNIVVVDCDSPEGRKNVDQYIRQTLIGKIPMVSTGAGFHLYFKHPGNILVPNRKDMFKNVDVRGDGGYVVAPPSLHPSGRTYAWASLIVQLKDAPEVPPELLNSMLNSPSVKSEPKPSAPKGKASTVVWSSYAKSSNPNKPDYLVRLMSSGYWHCKCDGNSKWRLECHHIKEKKIEYENIQKGKVVK